MGTAKGVAEWHGKKVPVTFLSGVPYMDVATKIALAHEDGGFSEVSHEFLKVGEKDVVRICIEFKGQRFYGSAMVKWGGKNADATDPVENAETSAKGRALSAAGFQISSVASADDMERLVDRTVESEPPRQLPKKAPALPPPSAKAPSIAEQCLALANDLHMSEDARGDLKQQFTVNGKIDWQGIKDALMREAQHNGHMEALHGALAAHPAD